MEVIKFQKLRDVKTPERGTSGSAGIDFFVPNDFSARYLFPGQDIKIPSGIRVKLPHGYALIAFNKSGIAQKGLQVGACVVDEDYQGEVHIHVFNWSKTSVRISPNMKLIQFLLLPVSYAQLEEGNGPLFDIPTERGEGGFGSTGE